MTPLFRPQIAIKALRQLGPGKVLLFASYQLKLQSGLLKWITKPKVDWRADPQKPHAISSDLILLPSRDRLAAVLGKNQDRLLASANEIIDGTTIIFGHKRVPLDFKSATPLKHWTCYTDRGNQADIKFTWEAARFGWALVLARAYHLTQNEAYSRAFWKYTTEFLLANPPNLGPHWMSAQEVGLRLICLVFAFQVFAHSAESTPEHRSMLATAIHTHAARIPPTLDYARAQNNNHLISEAAALFTAGLALPSHPRATAWRNTGWRWLSIGLYKQIAADGTYIQHSVNYQRLVLQLSLWCNALAMQRNLHWPIRVQLKLAQASMWLLRLMEYSNGSLPNLGPNDGAYLLPLSTHEFADFRPTVQAANLAFNQTNYFEDRPWQEMALWFGLDTPAISNPLGSQKTVTERAGTPHVLRNPGHKSWAYLRAARFTDRPGHADQLHLDLWWRGFNLAQDAGSYLYNAAPPWDNALAGTDVHNTLTINEQQQMRRAGRFLWLDWAQAHIQEETRTDLKGWYKGLLVKQVSAVHNGYRALGITHRREVYYDDEDRWHVNDSILSNRDAHRLTVRLHWLLPDWEWELKANLLKIKSPHGWLRLYLHGDSAVAGKLDFQIVRAGELVFGERSPQPHWGWVSPSYGEKKPALSFASFVEATPPLTLHTTWEFPH